MNFSKFSKNALLAAGLVAAMSSCNKDMKDEISTTKSNVESNQAALAAQNDASEAEIAKQDSLRAVDLANAQAAEDAQIVKEEAAAAEEAAEEAAAAAEEEAYIAANSGYTYSNDGTATIEVDGTNTSGLSYSKELTLGVTNKAGNTYKVEEKFVDTYYYAYNENDVWTYYDLEFRYIKETWHVTLWANTASSAQEEATQSMVNVIITRNSGLSGSTESIVTNQYTNLYIDEARIASGDYDLTEDDGFNFWEAEGDIYQAWSSSSYGFNINDFSYDVSSHDIAFDLYTTNENGDDIELDIEVQSKILRELSTSY
jgi:hypothetical protein